MLSLLFIASVFMLFSFVFAALAVLLDFLLQVTAFVALITFDFLRAEDKRVDCFPCIKVPSHANSDKGLPSYCYFHFYLYQLMSNSRNVNQASVRENLVCWHDT